MTPPSPAGLARLAVAIVLTVFVLWIANPADILRAGLRADLGWLGLAVALVIVDRALMAYRWMMLLCPIAPSGRPAFGPLLRVFFISSFSGIFLPLPGNAGADIVRAYQLSRLNVRPAEATASVLLDRLLGMMSIVLVGIAGFLLTGPGDAASNRAIAISLAAGSAACLAGAAVIFSDRAAGAARRAARLVPSARVQAMAGALADATRAYARYHRELAWVLAGSIGVQVLRVLQAWCLGRAIAIDASLDVYFGFIPLIMLIMLLPISVSGIGTTQVAFVWFFARVGTPEPDAVALSVLFQGLGIVGSLPGGLLLAFGGRDGISRRASGSPSG